MKLTLGLALDAKSRWVIGNEAGAEVAAALYETQLKHCKQPAALFLLTMENAVVHKTLWVVDALQDSCMDALQHALRSAANTLAVCTDPLRRFQTGLCAICRPPEVEETQLRLLQSLSKLCLKRFHQAVAKLRASAVRVDPDQYKMASILKSVLDMLKRKGGTCTNEKGIQEKYCVNIIAQDVQFGKHLEKALQLDTDVDVRFIVFPPLSDRVPGTDIEASEATLKDFASGIAHMKNVSLIVCPRDPLGFVQGTLIWVHDVLLNHQKDVELVIPGMDEVFGHDRISCTYAKHIVGMDLNLSPTILCPCHGQPLTKCNSFGQTVEDRETPPPSISRISGISDARCSVTGVPLRCQDCIQDNSIVTIGGSNFKLPPSIHLNEQVLDKNCAQGMMKASTAATIHIWALVPFDQVSDAYTYGLPHLLFPSINPGKECTAEMLCALLNRKKQVLLGESKHDLDSPFSTSKLPRYYIIRPDKSCSSFLVKKLLSREEILPLKCPNAYKANPDMESMKKLEVVVDRLKFLETFNPVDLQSRHHSTIDEIVQHSTLLGPALSGEGVQAPWADKVSNPLPGGLKNRKQDFASRIDGNGRIPTGQKKINLTTRQDSMKRIRGRVVPRQQSRYRLGRK